jgi:hypothetical protein
MSALFVRSLDGDTLFISSAQWPSSSVSRGRWVHWADFVFEISHDKFLSSIDGTDLLKAPTQNNIHISPTGKRSSIFFAS